MSLIDATSADWRLVPQHLRGDLQRWVDDGIRPGHFLSCVLRNDLEGAATYGDSESTAGLIGLVRFLRECAPRTCWGSPEAFTEWPSRLSDMREAS